MGYFSFKLTKSVIKSWLFRSLGHPFSMPYKYIFLVTDRCQSRCKVCRIWKIHKKNPDLIKKELNLEEYQKIFDNIKDHAVWASFSGGEPFLRKDIDEIVLSACKTLENLKMVNMPTNGLAVDKIKKSMTSMLGSCRNDVKFFVTVSIDGPERLNDKIRGVKGGFKRAWKTYKLLSGLRRNYENLEVGIQATISKYNMGQIEEIIKFTNESSFPVFAYTAEADYFNNLNDDVDLKKMNMHKLLECLRTVYRNYPIKRFESLIPKIFLKLGMKFYDNGNAIPCYASFASITVDPYGNVKPCSYFPESIENVRDHVFSMEKILRSERAWSLRNMVKSRNCPRCWNNCEGYVSIIQNPLLAVKEFLR